jgi:hypothetical protein
MWAVAKKSPVGENDILVATLAVRKASMRCPEGMSNVLIIESRDVVMSHRESEEKVYVGRGDEAQVNRPSTENPQGLELVHQIHRTLELSCGSRCPKVVQRGRHM